MKVLSFNSCIEADINICCGDRKLTQKDEIAIRDADAVILPQGCREDLYRLVRKNCANVFPNYDAFYKHPEKTGQIELFLQHKAPCPQTRIFENLASYHKTDTNMPFSKPFVFKLPWGGEGKNVFLVNTQKDLENVLNIAADWERQDKKGFLLQEYIPTGGRSLRIVVIGNKLIPYWRINKNADSFYTNIAKGAVVEHDSFPKQQEAAVRALKEFCRKTGINLAGFDFLFSINGKNNCIPLFLEINYFFRTKGLGGHDNYIKLLADSIKEWLAAI